MVWKVAFWASVGALVVLIGAMAFAQELPNHDTPSTHWYDGQCCSNRDCRPLVEGEIKFDKAGTMYLRNTAYGCGWKEVEQKRIKQSQDWQTHGCFSLASDPCNVLCAYIGGGV